MKKVLAIALALVFMFALAIPAFATVSKDASNVTISDNKAYNEALATQENDGTNATEIRYDVSGNYIITVPALITLESEVDDVHTPNVRATGSATISASNVIIPYQKELVVSMHGNIAGSAEIDFQIASAGQVIPYTVSTDNIADVVESDEIVADGTAVAKDVLVIQDGGTRSDAGGYTSGSVVVNFEADTLAKYQARYQGTITFTVGIRDSVVAGA